MNRLICIYLVIFVATISCTKENPLKIGESLPYESSSIKLELISSSLPFGIRDIYFSDASNGIAVSYDGKIYKSDDYGISWTTQYSNPVTEQPFYQILFTDTNIGYVVGGSTSCGGTGCTPSGGVILKTIDGGASWINVFQAGKVEIVSIAKNSSGDLFAVSNGTKGRIIRSTDNGSNWSTIDSTDFHLEKVTFSDNIGYCTGANGKIIRSINNGSTWELAATLNAYYVSDIRFISNSGYCIANNQSIYKTNDTGTNWVQKYSSDFFSLVLHPVTETRCLVFGGGSYTGGDFGYWYGAFRQTTDSGDDWNVTELTDIGPIRYISFYSPTDGYVVADNKLIKVTLK